MIQCIVSKQVHGMDDISDLINDLPAALDDGSDSGAGHSDIAVADADVDDQSIEATDDEEDTDTSDTSEEETDESDEDTSAEATDDNDQDDYIVDDEDDDQPAATATSTIDTTKLTQDEFVLAGLTKLTARVIGPDDKVYTVQAYGNGDLPRDMKGFASKYEEKLWDAAVIEQNAKARDLIKDYQTAKTTAQAEADGKKWVRMENMAIREDLNDLIREGMFPKFKGEPKTREFDESPGGKEFTRVINYMQKQNEKFRQDANKGRAYRHIGFREAFVMLNGENPKAAEKAEDKARKVVAKKLKTGTGVTSTKSNVNTTPVSNLTDLASEFEAFAGSTK